MSARDRSEQMRVSNAMRAMNDHPSTPPPFFYLPTLLNTRTGHNLGAGKLRLGNRKVAEHLVDVDRRPRVVRPPRKAHSLPRAHHRGGRLMSHESSKCTRAPSGGEENEKSKQPTAPRNVALGLTLVNPATMTQFERPSPPGDEAVGPGLLGYPPGCHMPMICPSSKGGIVEQNIT